jgi:uncharacterized membrane protein
MYSRVKIFGHPLHPMLVAFPVAFYTATLAALIAFHVTADEFWLRVSFVANVAGVAMALLAALPGFIDWAFGIPRRTAAKQTGLYHMLLNVSALVLFALNLALREPGVGLLLCGLGFALTLIAGFLGWSLVQRHHVGVDPPDIDERIEATRQKHGHASDGVLPAALVGHPDHGPNGKRDRVEPAPR